MQPTNDADARGRWLGELLDRHGAALALYASHWTNNAEDCVQEALVQLAGQQPQPDRPVAWLYRAVKHKALNQRRGESRRRNREQQAWQRRLHAMAGESTRTDLLDAVASLPQLRREVMMLKIWGALTFAEMEDVLGRSASTLQREYSKGIHQLQKQWGEPCQNLTETE